MAKLYKYIKRIKTASGKWRYIYAKNNKDEKIGSRTGSSTPSSSIFTTQRGTATEASTKNGSTGRSTGQSRSSGSGRTGGNWEAREKQNRQAATRKQIIDTSVTVAKGTAKVATKAAKYTAALAVVTGYAGAKAAKATGKVLKETAKTSYKVVKYANEHKATANEITNQSDYNVNISPKQQQKANERYKKLKDSYNKGGNRTSYKQYQHNTKHH